ncbi:MupG family TIM beta-alpha barrel fold protein, partial [Peribacillus frigoritolerans]
MRRLGISIYPEHSTPDKDKQYIKLAHSYGFERIFTCL